MLDERTKELSELQAHYTEMLRCRGGGGQPSTEGGGGGGEGEGGGATPSTDAVTAPPPPPAEEENWVEAEETEAAEEEAEAVEEAKEEEEVMVVPPPAAEEPAEAPATDPPPPPPTELLGRNQWHGFRLAPEEVTKPTDEFRLKFPPMASCLCGDEKSLIIMAGGGGSSRAGIPNAIVFGGLSDGGQCNQTAHHGTGLEAVTSLSADVTTGVMATVQSDRVKLYRMAIGDDAFDATVKERAAAAEEAAGDGEEAVPIPVHDKPHLGCLVGKARELDVLPAGALPLTLKDGEELPAERKPYVVALSPTGNLLAVGMEDGALLIFGLSKAKGGGLNDWSLITRAKSHTKEIKSLCFSYSGATLATAAPDGQCLLWQAPPATGGTMPEPKPVSRPRFWFAGPNQKPRKNASAKKKADALLTQWRCVAMPSDPPKSSRGRLLLYGALNHAGGPGWVAKCDATSGRWQAKGKASNSMLTTLAVSPDGRLVVTGSSEGELICMDGASLQRLLRLVPHDLFITNLLLRATAEPTGVAALEAATEAAAGPPQVTYTAITCAGDNSIRLTQLTPARLKKGSGMGSLVWLSVLVLLVAIVYMRLFSGGGGGGPAAIVEAAVEPAAAVEQAMGGGEAEAPGLRVEM